jgi:hypothetical protein
MIYTPKYLERPVKTEPFDTGNGIKQIIRVPIEGDEYAFCDKNSKQMWANKKTGNWGKGMMNNPNDPRKVERSGLLGEMAFAKFIGKPVEFEYKEFGDGGTDVIFFDKRFDIKTSLRNYGALLIKVFADNGMPVLKNKDTEVFVAAILDEDDPKLQKAVVLLLGYQEKAFVDKLEVVPARKGKHYNREVPYSQLIGFHEKPVV